MLAEHLTEQEVDIVEARCNAYDEGLPLSRKANIEETRRLIADWREMRRLLVELTADEQAGIEVMEGDNDVHCFYCDASVPDGSTMAHAPDCPIVRGRALVEAHDAHHD